MPVSFVAAGVIADNATVATQAIVAPACAVDDILIACLINKSATTNVISAPDGTWTQIVQANSDCTTAADDHRYAIFWKRATASGGTFTFTKATDDNVTFGGMISAWRGCPTAGSPIDATTPAAQTNVAAADNVTFPAFDPTATNAEILFIAFYGNDVTTFAAAMSADTNPDCTTRFDLESATGTDYTIACTSGLSNGAAIASRTWASVSTTDAGSTGVVFGLISYQPYVATGGIAAGGFPVTSRAGLPASDAFTDTDAVLLTTHTRAWAFANSGSFRIYGNEVKPAAGGVDGLAHWQWDTFNNNQYSQAIVGALNGDYIGLNVRGTGNTCYYAGWNNTTIVLRKMSAGANSSLQADLTLALTTGDVMRLEVSGSAITLKRNGTTIMSGTDAGIASGTAGLYQAGAGGSSAASGHASWEGGNLSTLLNAIYVPKGGLAIGGRAEVTRTKVYEPKGGLAIGGSAVTSKSRIFTAAVLLGGLAIGGSAVTSKSTSFTSAPKGGAAIGGFATTSKSRIFTAPSSGGAALGGRAALSRTEAYEASGGLAAGGSGSASRSHIFTAPSSGGVAIGGASAIARAYETKAKGGVTLGGTAALSKTRVSVGSGGAAIAGRAATSSATPLHIYSPSGGAAAGGKAATSILTPLHVYVPTGGAALGGSAAVSRTFAAQASGGVALGGKAAVSRTFDAKARGGIALGGATATSTAAAPASVYTYSASGGGALAGRAPVASTKVWTGAGGGTLGGRATTSLVSPVTFTYPAKGGAAVGGKGVTSIAQAATTISPVAAVTQSPGLAASVTTAVPVTATVVLQAHPIATVTES